MIRSIATVAACCLAFMVVIKDGRVLRATGLTGVCTIAQQAADGSELEACRPGKLEGRPDLSRRGCKVAGTAGTYEYWKCPGLQTTAP